MNLEFEICLVFDQVFGIEIAEMEKERNKGRLFILERINRIFFRGVFNLQNKTILIKARSLKFKKVVYNNDLGFLMFTETARQRNKFMNLL